MTEHELLTQAYRLGLKEGLTKFAFWKDGKQYCGTSSHRLLSDELIKANEAEIPLELTELLNDN